MTISPDTTLAQLAQMVREEKGSDWCELHRPLINAMYQVLNLAPGDFCVEGEFGTPEPRRLLDAEVVEALRYAVEIVADDAGKYSNLSN